MPVLTGDRDDWLAWHDLLGKASGRLPTPDLDGLTVAEARDAWQATIFGAVQPDTGHDGEAVTAIRTDDFRGGTYPLPYDVAPLTALYLTTATFTPVAYLVTGDGQPLFTGDDERLYVEYS
jgi:hypothetical protein